MLLATSVVLYVGLSALVALCGRRRRMGPVGAFILSLLITPAVALLLLYLTEGRTSLPPAIRPGPGSRV